MTSGLAFSVMGARFLWKIMAARAGVTLVTGGNLITVTQSALSTSYVQVQVVPSAGGYDPSSDSVQFAFTPSTYPETAPITWYAGSWSVQPGPAYWAQCLVGPTGGVVTLTAGTLYQVWVKITDNPEVPVLQQVFLQVTP